MVLRKYMKYSISKYRRSHGTQTSQIKSILAGFAVLALVVQLLVPVFPNTVYAEEMNANRFDIPDNGNQGNDGNNGKDNGPQCENHSDNGKCEDKKGEDNAQEENEGYPCYDEANNKKDCEDEYGTIIIVKDTVPDNGQDFNFTAPKLIPSSFILDDDGGVDDTFSNQIVFENVPANSQKNSVPYHVTEDASQNSVLSSIVCDDSNSEVNLADRSAIIELNANEVVTCTFTNTLVEEEPEEPEEPTNEVVPCGQNMVVNGSFEFPVVTSSQNWDVYLSGTPGMGWVIKWTADVGPSFNSDTKPAIANLELHKGVNGWTSADGVQHAEMDADWFGPASSTSGEPANISLYQNIPTQEGVDYKLAFAYSPRPGNAGATSILKVFWNGVEVHSVTREGQAGVDWSDETVTVVGIDGISKLEFREAGTADSFGSFLDNVVLQNEYCSSTVTICKYDTEVSENTALPGWTMFLLGDHVGTVQVYPNGTNYLSGSLPAGNYVVRASGEYTYRPSDPDASVSDAAYSKRLESDTVYGGPYAPWVRVNDFSNPHTGWLGIQINESFTDWGSEFNPSHIYHTSVSHPGSEMKFRILDDQYADNSDFLTVDIYEGYMGITGENGCVTFQKVPLGEYDLSELMEEGWELVSGTGPVEVDEPTETFNVVNKEIELIEPCVITSTWATDVLGENQGLRKNNTPVLASRSDSSDVLGAPNGPAEGMFYSLGKGGSITLGFGGMVVDGAGADLTIYEITNGRASYPEEQAQVKISQDGVGWVQVGVASSKPSGTTGIDISGSGLTWFKYVMLTDSTNFGLNNAADADGFDIDAVQAHYLTCEKTVSGMKWNDKDKDGELPDGTSDEGGLPGWTIIAVDPTPVADFAVDSQDQDGVDSPALAAGQYFIHVSGTWLNRNGQDTVDAEYNSYDGFATAGMDGDPAWTVFGLNDYWNLLDLQMDNNFVDWGSFVADHDYYRLHSTGGGSLNFKVFDGNPDTNTINPGWYGDNSGSLQVKIYKVLAYDVTDLSGDYTLTLDGSVGNVLIFEVPQDGWEQTYPQPNDYHSINLLAGDEFFGYDFGNHSTSSEPCRGENCGDGDDGGGCEGEDCGPLDTPGSISGSVYNDANNNGTLEEDEMTPENSLSDWLVYLDLDNDGVHDEDEPSDVTASPYSFVSLADGSYTVRLVLQSQDWEIIFPTPEAKHDVIVDSDDHVERDFGVRNTSQGGCTANCITTFGGGGGGPTPPPPPSTDGGNNQQGLVLGESTEAEPEGKTLPRTGFALSWMLVIPAAGLIPLFGRKKKA